MKEPWHEVACLSMWQKAATSVSTEEKLQKHFLCSRGAQQCCRSLCGGFVGTRARGQGPGRENEKCAGDDGNEEEKRASLLALPPPTVPRALHILSHALALTRPLQQSRYGRESGNMTAISKIFDSFQAFTRPSLTCILCSHQNVYTFIFAFTRLTVPLHTLSLTYLTMGHIESHSPKQCKNNERPDPQLGCRDSVKTAGRWRQTGGVVVTAVVVTAVDLGPVPLVADFLAVAGLCPAASFGKPLEVVTPQYFVGHAHVGDGGAQALAFPRFAILPWFLWIADATYKVVCTWRDKCHNEYNG